MPSVLVLEDEPSSQELARRALHRLVTTDIAIALAGDSGLKILTGWTLNQT
jgi:CheY-like chemotaxis protein